MGIFGPGNRTAQVRYAKQLLLREPSDSQSSRAPLDVCQQCGDLGCGAVSVFASRREECVVWLKIGFDSTLFPLVLPFAEEQELEIEQARVRDFWFEGAAARTSFRSRSSRAAYGAGRADHQPVLRSPAAMPLTVTTNASTSRSSSVSDPRRRFKISVCST